MSWTILNFVVLVRPLEYLCGLWTLAVQYSPSRPGALFPFPGSCRAISEATRVNASNDQATSSAARLMPWLVYPVLMIFVPALYLVLLAMGVDLLVSTYAPILLAAGAACLLERLMPYRRARWSSVSVRSSPSFDSSPTPLSAAIRSS